MFLDRPVFQWKAECRFSRQKVMIATFFRTAMAAPGRQANFRRAALAHVLFVAAVVAGVLANPVPDSLQVFGYVLLGAGLVEGAVLVGWRLTQLPKSQALEFLLTSPVSARRIFIAETGVGICRLILVQLAGIPAFLPLLNRGIIGSIDLLVLLGMPLIWGSVAAFGLIVWAYETRLVRRLGEMVALLSILVYLTVGVLAGERLKAWLDALPGSIGDASFDAFRVLHTYNPFAVMRFWFDPVFGNPVVAIDRMEIVAGTGLALAVLLYLRGMSRLKGHFHDRHYRPIDSCREAQTEHIGERPLSWWAVKRVMEYSGRVNIWLAGGFGIVYAAYLLAGDSWPAWMGQTVFHVFERMGGAPALVTGLVVLAAVPAAFQYGLWDSTASDRCRRLELLLLTDLGGPDYWHASLSAAWRRGRGYMIVAGLLWLAMLFSGRATPEQVFLSIAAAAILWSFSFSVGFATFSSGRQANGLGLLLTLGLPLASAGLIRTGIPVLSAFLPPGAVYSSLATTPSWTWLPGPILVAIATLWLSRSVLIRCETRLRSWYDANQGLQPAGAR
jgi:hypothetical protein